MKNNITAIAQGADEMEKASEGIFISLDKILTEKKNNK